MHSRAGARVCHRPGSDPGSPNHGSTLAGDIVVYGSIQLAHALLEHGLADEVRLFSYPLVLVLVLVLVLGVGAGVGQRLFTETSDTKPLRLVRTRPLAENLVQLAYERAV